MATIEQVNVSEVRVGDLITPVDYGGFTNEEINEYYDADRLIWAVVVKADHKADVSRLVAQTESGDRVEQNGDFNVWRKVESLPPRAFDPECDTCISLRLREGTYFPPHYASRHCMSGGWNHCTCDTCF